jgi:hypothetical protein
VQKKGATLRERVLKIVLVLGGCCFGPQFIPSLAVYWIRTFGNGRDYDDGLLCRLGISMPIVVRNPSAHRSLIAFAAWPSFADAVVMSLLGFEETCGAVVNPGIPVTM